jgi:hypothetical protein
LTTKSVASAKKGETWKNSTMTAKTWNPWASIFQPPFRIPACAGMTRIFPGFLFFAVPVVSSCSSWLMLFAFRRGERLSQEWPLSFSMRA